MMDCINYFIVRFFRSRKDRNRDVPCDISVNIVQIPLIGVELETCASDRASGNASCGSSAGSNSDLNECDGETCVEQKAVKVNQVNHGSFAHVFGLRKNDIIFIVNGKRVESAQMASCIINKTIGMNKNGSLVMEIHRIERGLIRLNNQEVDGTVDEIDGHLSCVSCVSCSSGQDQRTRLKNLTYNQFLIVKNGNICLSSFWTNKQETYFMIYHYEKFVGDSALNEFIMLKHKASGKCLYVENGELIVKDLPQPVTRLPENSPYLFNIKTSSNTEAFFEAITSPGMAIGFKKPRRKAELLHESDVKVLFDIFEV